MIYRDFRELLDREDIDAVLIATGDRWHAPMSMLAAQAGKDVYSEKPCGITIAACQELADTIHREQRVFQAGTQRRNVLNFQHAVQLAHSGKLRKASHVARVGVHAGARQLMAARTSRHHRATSSIGICGSVPPHGDPTTRSTSPGRGAGSWDFDSGAKLLDWCAHTVDLCQWANQADDTMPVEYEPAEKNIVCRYANGVKIIIDFLAEPFGDRAPHYITRLGTCPVRFVGDEGWVETGDEGEIVASSESLQKELPKASKRVRALDVDAHSRDFFDCIRSRGSTAANADVMRRSHIASHAAAISWVLKRKLILDPVKEEFVRRRGGKPAAVTPIPQLGDMRE